MNPIVINGTVLCDNITGIPRYVYETVVRLDELIEGTGLDVRIAYRDDGRPIHLHLPPGEQRLDMVAAPLHVLQQEGQQRAAPLHGKLHLFHTITS